MNKRQRKKRAKKLGIPTFDLEKFQRKMRNHFLTPMQQAFRDEANRFNALMESVRKKDAR